MERVYITLNFNITLLLPFRLPRTFSDDNILYFYIAGHEKKKRHSCAQYIERAHTQKKKIIKTCNCLPYNMYTSPRTSYNDNNMDNMNP